MGCGVGNALLLVVCVFLCLGLSLFVTLLFFFWGFFVGVGVSRPPLGVWRCVLGVGGVAYLGAGGIVAMLVLQHAVVYQ